MKLLVVAPSYPHPGHPFSGTFNEKSVVVLRSLCDEVVVLAPRPYVPPGLSFVPRWKAYAQIPGYELRNGIPIYRPATLVIPKIGSALWADLGAFLCCRHTARQLHAQVRFDAILSFDLGDVGGVAWRLSQDLRIPAAGWAYGEDVRFPPYSSLGAVVRRALERLDIVFYQSHELLGCGAELLGVSLDALAKEKHIVLPRGIPEPPPLHRSAVRKRVRAGWGVTDDRIVVLFTGRLIQAKGIEELFDALAMASARDPRIIGVIVGSNPAFDETALVQERLSRTPRLREHIRLLPACPPHQIWDYLCAADIFAFPSHREGISNSLLEAMIMQLPAVTFAIPSSREVDGGTGALVLVPPFDTALFAEQILRLATSPPLRSHVGQQASKRVRDRFLTKNNMAEAVYRLTQVVDKHGRSAGLHQDTTRLVWKAG